MLRWSRGLQECSAMAVELEGVRLVSVMDREGDCFELFVARRRLGNVELLVRARYNRSLGKGVAKLFDAIRRQSEQGRLEVFVGHRSARRSSRSQKAVSKQDARVAQASLRWRQVQLRRCRAAVSSSCRCRAAVSSTRRAADAIESGACSGD